jgi:GPH family glycoside/pentoside/hexuronide:cation symporter
MKPNWELSFWKRFSYAVGDFPSTIVPALIVSWVTMFYCPPRDSGRIIFAPILYLGLANFFGRIVDAVSDPVIGFWSDRIRTSWGRRIPFIFVGTLPLSICFYLLWFPPVAGESIVNVYWAALMLGLIWFFYTVVVAPYLALGAEITSVTDERVNISVWQSVFEVAGNIGVQLGLAQILIICARGWGFMTNGYQVAALIIAVLTFVGFYFSILWVREKPASPAKEVPFSFFHAITLTFRNEAFPIYLAAISLLRLSADIVLMAIPYMAVTVMGADESAGGRGLALMPIVAVICFLALGPLTRAWGLKTLYLRSIGLFVVVTCLFCTVGYWGVFPPRVQGYIMCGLLGVPAAALMTLWRPLVAEMVDYDERKTGYRREAIYFGVEGLATKFATGVAAVFVGFFFDKLGYSIEHHLGVILAGPFAAVLALIAYLVFRRYPLGRTQGSPLRTES